jgi:acetoin utilization protein AcuB
MAIRAIMSSPVETVNMDDRLSVVKSVFERTHFHHLLVVEEKKLLGVISDRDLLKTISPTLGTAAEVLRDTAILNKRAHQIMTRSPIFLHEGDMISQAIDVFLNNNVSCIPVLDGDENVAGIVSWRDILRAISVSSNSLPP